MRIAILSNSDAKCQDLNDLIRPNRVEYCNRHGMDYLDEPIIVEQLSLYNNSAPKNITYYKIAMLYKYIDSYDYLIWLDSDIVITNHSINLLDLVQTTIGSSFSIWFPKCIKKPQLLCSAYIIVRCDNVSKKILHSILFDFRYAHYYNNYVDHEEGAFLDYIFNKCEHFDKISCVYIPNIWTTKLHTIDLKRLKYVQKYGKLIIDTHDGLRFIDYGIDTFKVNAFSIHFMNMHLDDKIINISNVLSNPDLIVR